jgi:hypothetical protein
MRAVRLREKGKKERAGSDVGPGLAQAHDALAFLPLAALFEERDTLETLQDVAFDNNAARALETVVL